MHAIVTIGPDGTLAVAGPYTSEALAGRHADKLLAASPGLNVLVQPMQAPQDLARELRDRQT